MADRLIFAVGFFTFTLLIGGLVFSMIEIRWASNPLNNKNPEGSTKRSARTHY
jgi:hypothetical protein